MVVDCETGVPAVGSYIPLAFMRHVHERSLMAILMQVIARLREANEHIKALSR
jgi:hypothetical protein